MLWWSRIAPRALGLNTSHGVLITASVATAVPPVSRASASALAPSMSDTVSLEYLCRQHGEPCEVDEVYRQIAQIPERLQAIWRESEASGESSDVVADRMAQKLIGRG